MTVLVNCKFIETEQDIRMTIMDELKCYVARLVARLVTTNNTDDYATKYLPLRNSYLIAASVLSFFSSFSNKFN